ncbi:MAG: hypothetical protein ABI972_07170 [Acidobacteriota bacterium]
MSTTRGRLMEVCVPLCFLLLSFRAVAAPPPPLTTIQDQIYRADGTPYAGYMEIEWNSFETSDQSQIAQQSLRLRIFGGQLRTQLVATTTATPAAFYKVTYISDGKTLFTETWNVPPSTSILRVRDVRASLPGTVVGGGGGGGVGNVGSVTIADVDGLQAALDERIRAGASLVPGRAVVLNAFGEIATVTGADADCVRADGSTDLCATGAAMALGPIFRDGETPTGTVNGTNSVFTLSAQPGPASSLLLYRNGLLQKTGIDYTLSGSTITFLSGATPQAGDILVGVYRITGTPASYPQVLCSSSGSGTSQTTLLTLGTCTIPANVLQEGDRVEVSFLYTHEGSAMAFEHRLLWGSTTVQDVAQGTSETVSACRYGFGAGTATIYWSGQNWGSSAAATTGAGSFAQAFNVPQTVAFQARMTATTAETVTLRNYTVVRYPKP